MQVDRERLALAVVNVFRENAGFTPIASVTEVIGRDTYRAGVDAILADIEAQGFVIVPRAPCENTQLHGRDAISDQINRKDDDVTITAEDAAACWRAMIDAATAEKGT